jgi:predicted nucleotidyltransferase
MVVDSKDKAGTDHYYRYWPPNIPVSAIRRFAGKIAKRYDADQIILFGSHAYGSPDEYSDVDLLVVMPARDELTQAARVTLAFDPVFPLDLIVRTPDHLRRGLAEGDSFLQEVMTKGIVLYEKSNAGVGPQSRRRLERRSTRSRRGRAG